MTTLQAVDAFEQQLDASPLTRSMGLLWLLAASFIALDGFDFFIIGLALPFLQQTYHLTPVAVGAIASAAIVGSLVGSLAFGPITDRIGRQRMLVLDIALFLLASVGTVCAWDTLSLIGFRGLLGVAIGADYPLSVAYITENVPARLRGRMVIGAFTFQAVGALLGALSAIALMQFLPRLAPADVALRPDLWRWMLGVGIIPVLLIAWLRWRFAFESPRYYLARGDYEAASRAATQLLGQAIVLTPATDPPDRDPPLPYTALFSPAYRRHTLLATLPWFLQDIATYGMGIFTPTLMALLAFADQTDWQQRTLAAATGAAVVDLFLIVGFLLAVVLIDRVGRMPLQITGFIGMALGLVLLALAGDPTFNPASHLGWVLAGFVIFNLCMNCGPNATTFLLAGEVFPTAIRASGAGLAAAIAKAGAVLGAFALPWLQHQWGVTNLLLLLAGCCLLAAGVTYGFRLETKGRSLSAIAQDDPANFS